MDRSCSQKKRRKFGLTFDCIIEILSWLPVGSLLRLKCVCKQWHSVIQEHNFIVKNMDRTSPILHRYPCKSSRRENFEFVSSCAGLCLEKSDWKVGVYRIRNPSTHQVLYLPDVSLFTEEVDFAFNSSTGECKAVCLYKEKQFKNMIVFGLKIITIGKDEQWRPLEIPDQNKLRKKTAWKASTGGVDKVTGVCHFVQVIRLIDHEEEDQDPMYLEVHSLDLWSERFTTNTLPRRCHIDLYRVSFGYWNNCLSFGYATWGSHVLLVVLEDYKKPKWSKNKIIIPIKGYYVNDGRKFPLGQEILINEYDLHIIGGNYRLSYVKKVKITEGGKILHKASLVTLKGMVTEDGYNLAESEGS